ncbi:MULTISPECIES: ABC transporter ATP-binding protein [Clostridium]|uniref:ABC transporter ATP-binding protein n=1 Tax=Clostridium novyi (strain NT) TaxID=386415 RepID=A0Q1V2_CLONN|nr:MULTISPECIES: ATP-binding cassette domain-containing protein [Clostridium]ABK62279.1 ABC transporter ATP-binding protein [Clostridium novyi NT]KEH87501.1 ABC transporter ATP-binding protein [Clostridium novyi A str. 4540]KEH88032.1 ABC transporter ATP-binding protein [Clostridium novyi A str. NCTC 538]KEH91064.1 ABC transporter ATP-binding protein [Clostridium novyi A str. BKT29909]KEH93766.1 ABC transporter ATP-binding protein [Clostridium botulinum C/D str. It1]
MLELKNLSLEVEENDKKISILDNINLTLQDNKIYVITGPNGGGKSSLCKMMMGIYKPTSGNIILDGEDITKLDITGRANKQIGYAFQQPPHFKGMTVRGLLNLAGKDSKEKVDVHELLNNVGLCTKDYIDREINSSLSGGELKRIEIASVLARDLKLAIFDEPEAGIDLWSFQRLVETFTNMHKERNTTIVIISHQERIINLADEVIVLSNGKIQKTTSKEEIISEIKAQAACDYCGTCETGR